MWEIYNSSLIKEFKNHGELFKYLVCLRELDLNPLPPLLSYMTFGKWGYPSDPLFPYL